MHLVRTPLACSWTHFRLYIHTASSRRAKAALLTQGESEQLCLWQLEQSWHPFTKYQGWLRTQWHISQEGRIYNLDETRGFSPQPGWSDRAQSFLLAFPVIIWEVMSFSLVCSPYNGPPFASKQAQWSKLDNVVPGKMSWILMFNFGGPGSRSDRAQFCFIAFSNLIQNIVIIDSADINL